MYSRFPNRRDPSVRIPEHYSGCAFTPPLPEDPPVVEQEEGSNDPFRTSDLPESTCRAPEEIDVPTSSEGIHTRFTGILPAFSNGMNSEDLLLLVLILLLMHAGQDTDVIQCLILLLFCKS